MPFFERCAKFALPEAPKTPALCMRLNIVRACSSSATLNQRDRGKPSPCTSQSCHYIRPKSALAPLCRFFRSLWPRRATQLQRIRKIYPTKIRRHLAIYFFGLGKLNRRPDDRMLPSVAGSIHVILSGIKYLSDRRQPLFSLS